MAACSVGIVLASHRTTSRESPLFGETGFRHEQLFMGCDNLTSNISVGEPRYCASFRETCQSPHPFHFSSPLVKEPSPRLRRCSAPGARTDGLSNCRKANPIPQDSRRGGIAPLCGNSAGKLR